MSLFLIAALPFLGAVFPALLIRAGRNACSWSAGLTTALALVGVLLHAPAVMRGEVIQARADWLPGLGLNANFFMDGLGMLFAILIGYVWFSELPTRVMLIGAALVIAGNILVIWREHQLGLERGKARAVSDPKS